LASDDRSSNLSNGKLTLNGRTFVIGRSIGTPRFKTTMQTYNNTQRKWYGYEGVDSYELMLHMRVDDFVDKGYWTKKY